MKQKLGPGGKKINIMLKLIIMELLMCWCAGGWIAMSKKKKKISFNMNTREFCMFYANKKCNSCGMCEEVEKPGFAKKLETGKIKSPSSKRQT